MNSFKIRVDKPINIIELQRILYAFHDRRIILELTNTKLLGSDILDRIKKLEYSSNIYFRIIGGYDDKRVNNYPRENYYKMHTEDNIYSLIETQKILAEIEKIEAGLKTEWDSFQKLIYFINYLCNKIIYHPFHEIQPSKDIRSLRGLISRKTVCAGYALILKELCDRHNIECQYVEGCCTKEDLEKGNLTHAWNIVTINGRFIPIDLTWNAASIRRGRSLSIEDIANVNEFIKSHFPGKHEVIQDYKRVLKSIDGTKIRSINNAINKDMTFDIKTFTGRGKNGTRYQITQLEEIVRENTYLYKYIYQDILKDGRYGPPVILYSGTNIASILANIERKNKLLKKLRESRQKGQTSEAEKIENQLIGSEYLEKANEQADELLFSVENINAAIRRKDYYLGKIEVERDEEFKSSIKGVFIDLSIMEEKKSRQRTFKRADGTSFVLQEWPYNSSIKRYYIYEPVPDKNYVIRNVIFTDNELLGYYNEDLPNNFLSRTRIDQCKALNGYMGRYIPNKDPVFTPEIYNHFTKRFYNNLTLKAEDFKDYFAEITFEEMKRLVRTYECILNDNQIICRNRLTKQTVTDANLILKIKFSNYWLAAAGIKWYFDEPINGYNYAFNEGSEEIFNIIYSLLIKSLNKNGNIDPLEIFDEVEKNSTYKYASDIVIRLFGSKESTMVINQLFRLQNPSSVKASNDIEFFAYHNDHLAYQRLMERRRLEEQKQILEVIKNGLNVEVIPKRAK